MKGIFTADHMGNVRPSYQIQTTGPGAAAATVTGQVSANWDCDDFGREVRATESKTPATGQPPGFTASDPWVDVLPFHFSTKFTDASDKDNYIADEINSSRVELDFLNRVLAKLRALCRCISAE